MTVSNASTASIEARAALTGLISQLDSAFVERTDVVRSMVCCLLAREHIVLLGDPGTGKSAMTNALCGAIGGQKFSVLMTKFTVPEEVFGPISLKGLEEDRYERVTKGMLPEASVAFLDEIFKANSAILNSLLTLVNERAFDNAGVRCPVPLEILIGASNELPQDECLGAMWDRFMVRVWVDPIRERSALRGLLANRAEPCITATVDAAQLATLRAEVDSVIIPDAVLDALLDLRDTLSRDHDVTASDRRWRKCIKIIAANAVMNGRGLAEKVDLLALCDALWSSKDERHKVTACITKLVAPDLAMATKILAAARELVEGKELDNMPLSDGGAGIVHISEALRAMLVELAKLDPQSTAQTTQDVLAIQARVARAVKHRLGVK